MTPPESPAPRPDCRECRSPGWWRGHVIDDDGDVHRAGDLDIDERGPSSNEHTGAQRRRGVTDDAETAQLGADHAVGDDGGVGFGRGSRQPDGRASRHAADEPHVVLQHQRLAVFAGLDDDGRSRFGALKGRANRLAVGPTVMVAAATAAAGSMAGLNGAGQEYGRSRDRGGRRDHHEPGARDMFARRPRGVTSCRRRQQRDDGSSPRRVICPPTRLRASAGEPLPFDVDDADVVLAPGGIGSVDQILDDLLRTARQPLDDLLDSGRVDQVRQAIAAQQQRRIRFERNLVEVDEIRIVGFVRVGTDVAIHLIPPRMVHRLELGDLMGILALANR